MRLRPVLSAAAAALVLTAPAALAAPFSYADPADAALPGIDIVRVTYSVSRTSLVVRMDLAGPAVTAPGVVYRATATVDGCGETKLTFAPSTVWDAAAPEPGWLMADCANFGPAIAGRTGYVLPVPVAVAGSSLTWTVPLGDLAPVATRGSRFKDFLAVAEPADPVFGVAGAAASVLDVFTGGFPFDVARSAQTWKMG